MAAYDHTFRSAIPGSSMAYKPGSFPHSKPPKYVKPEEFLDYLWNQLHIKDNLKMMWHLMEQGATAWALTRAILTKAAFDGTIQMNLAIVVYPTVNRMIATIGQSKGINVKLLPKFKSKSKDMMMKNKLQNIMKQNKQAKAGQQVVAAKQAQANQLPAPAVGLLNNLQQQQAAPQGSAE